MRKKVAWIHQHARFAGTVAITNATGISVKVEVTRVTWSKILAARWSTLKKLERTLPNHAPKRLPP
jgi:hypothetical protein